MGRDVAIVGCILAALVPALASCTSSKQEAPVEPNLYPSSYKQEVVRVLRGTLAEPSLARGAFSSASISDPVLTTVGGDQRYTLCVRSSDRDNKGQYVSKVRIGYFYAGSLNALIAATGDECAKAVYKPFPELEKLQ